MDKIMDKIKRDIEDIEYGRIEIVIHQGQVKYIEKKEKEKIENKN